MGTNPNQNIWEHRIMFANEDDRELSTAMIFKEAIQKLAHYFHFRDRFVV